MFRSTLWVSLLFTVSQADVNMTQIEKLQQLQYDGVEVAFVNEKGETD